MSGNAAMDSAMLAILLEELHKQDVKAAVLSVEYSLAPEFPYPRSLKEVLAAYHHLTTVLHIPPSRITMGAAAALRGTEHSGMWSG